MTRLVRLYTPPQFEEVMTLVDLLAERFDLPPAERDRLTAFQADLQQTVREDRRRATGAARLPVSAGSSRHDSDQPRRGNRHLPGRADHCTTSPRRRQPPGCAAADAPLASLAPTRSCTPGAGPGHFAVRTELHPDHVRIEVEDFGGPWRRRQPDGRPHGLDMVEALTGPDGWGTETTTSGGRIVWARLDLPPGE